MAMSELQREEILEQRSNSRGRVKNARMLADFRSQQQNRSGVAAADDAVSKAAKRSSDYLHLQVVNLNLYLICRPTLGAWRDEREVE